MHKCRA